MLRAAAAGALAWSGGAIAATPERSPEAAYVRARAAAEAGAPEQASAGFRQALAAAPASELIASQALNHAVAAGDWPLALDAARRLEAAGALLPDGRFLLLADALRREDWGAAKAQLDAIERDELFAFTLPVLRAWLAHETGAGDPIAILDEGAGVRGAPGFIAEHRPLLLSALGREQGARMLIEGAGGIGARAHRLRLGAAAALAGRGKRDAALALLEGEEPAFAAARALIAERRPVPGAIDDPASAAAELFVTLAFDLQREDLAPMAVNFARLATWLAPDNGEAWLVASELVAGEQQPGAAVALLEPIGPGDPYAEAARDQRIRLLARAGDVAAAIAGAEAIARAPGAGVSEWIQLAELYRQDERPRDAAEALGHALAVRTEATPEWALWLLRGSLYLEAGDWEAAHGSLREAHRLAPGEAAVLNDLGYALLDRGENMAEAVEMIREAHRLAPDSPAITDSLGWALYLRGETERAIELLEIAAKSEPADVEINEHLGDAYYAAGRRIEARYAWRAALVYAEGEAAERLRGKIAGGLAPELAGR